MMPATHTRASLIRSDTPHTRLEWHEDPDSLTSAPTLESPMPARPVSACRGSSGIHRLIRYRRCSQRPAAVCSATQESLRNLRLLPLRGLSGSTWQAYIDRPRPASFAPMSESLYSSSHPKIRTGNHKHRQQHPCSKRTSQSASGSQVQRRHLSLTPTMNEKVRFLKSLGSFVASMVRSPKV